MGNDDGDDLCTIFNKYSPPGVGTDLESERRIARSLNCTNSEEPPAPPATTADSGADQSAQKKKKARTKKPDALKKTYRPNPSFPAEMEPDLQRHAADAQMCVGPYIVDLCRAALDPETGSKPGAANQKTKKKTGSRGDHLNLTAEQWRILYGMTNNLNQITKKLHGTGECDPQLHMLLLALINLLGIDEE